MTIIKGRAIIILAVLAGLLAGGCVDVAVSHAGEDAAAGLTGAWRGKVQFSNGSFAAVKNFEFMYVFNSGGTMMESSNYDFTAPPAPPAYGIWRKTGPRQYEAKYSCFMTKAPAAMEDLLKGGWPPGGHAMLVEKITVAENGKSYRAKIALDIFDQAGKPTEAGSIGEVVASRVSF